MSLLEAQGVSRRFGGLRALVDVDLDVAEGEILGVIGPNGAGKTTFVNVVTGVLRPTAGQVTYRGADITHWPMHRRARAGLVRTFQGVRLFAERTVLTNVEVGAYLRGRSGVVGAVLGLPAVAEDELVLRRCAMEALRFFGLEDRADVPAAELSTGEQRLVGVARALAASPRLLLLDEPAAGLNETETARLTNALALLPGHGVTVMVVEHHMRLIMSLCDRVAVLDRGSLLALGTPEQVQRDPAVISAYLGDAA